MGEVRVGRRAPRGHHRVLGMAEDIGRIQADAGDIRVHILDEADQLERGRIPVRLQVHPAPVRAQHRPKPADQACRVGEVLGPAHGVLVTLRAAPERGMELVPPTLGGQLDLPRRLRQMLVDAPLYKVRVARGHRNMRVETEVVRVRAHLAQPAQVQLRAETA